jgi:hypothetical protein
MSAPPPLCAVRRLQSPLLPMLAFEQGPQDPLSQSVSMQDQYQTSSREYCEAKSNNDYESEKSLRKSNVPLA